jgi:hypothetical protein
VIKISLKFDMEQLFQKLQTTKENADFATAKALTKTAQGVKADLRAAMGGLFKAPTKFTLNSLYIQPATKQSQFAVVGIERGATWLPP